jgi:tyrosyl-tRNA synthetase
VYNSTWLNKLSSSDFLKLCAKVTLAQLIERDDFAKRIKEQKPIGFHELMYPLLQAYDSVVLQADVELGGTDQTFNMMLGRNLQEQSGQKPQVVITMPLLEGLDGVNKMSKSLGNFVGLHDQPRDAFGKLMSISDQLMWRYFQVLLNTSELQLETWKKNIIEGSIHPMQLKKKMAHAIVAKFWSLQEADDAQHTFEMLFQKKDLSVAQEITLPDMDQPIWIVDLLKQLNVITSSSQGRRLIEQGAITIDGQRITDTKTQINVHRGMIVKAGKHQIFKIM